MLTTSANDTAFDAAHIALFDPDRLVYRREEDDDATAIEAICDQAFGPGRYVRAAERIRELHAIRPELCLVGTYGDRVVGSVRVTELTPRTSLMLGPLAVRPELKGLGIGKSLLRKVAIHAREEGYGAIFLVGDSAYYSFLGYRAAEPGRIVLPRPADPARTLVLDL